VHGCTLRPAPHRFTLILRLALCAVVACGGVAVSGTIGSPGGPEDASFDATVDGGRESDAREQGRNEDSSTTSDSALESAVRARDASGTPPLDAADERRPVPCLGTCNTGCCDGTTCVSGTSNNACGQGGRVCVNCTNDRAAPVCLAGASCGCTTSMDCPAGSACQNGICGLSCDAMHACQGGCCSNGTCSPGDQPGACALGRTMCDSCSGVLACLSGTPASTCGCRSAANCPAGQACNVATGQCATSCNVLSPCHGGCCSAAANGTCVGGTQTGACGDSGGTCKDCSSSSAGSACQSSNASAGGGHCGCNGDADCPADAGPTACDPQTLTCSTPCAIGCSTDTCCSADGKCRAANTSTACATGSSCTDCTGNIAGTACIAVLGSCGCWSSADCPIGRACSSSTLCATACDSRHPCNGGCCMGGTCSAGTGMYACGQLGAACIDCTFSIAGKACVSGACGCGADSDCSASQTCDQGSHVCR
jgi:hypothetical protein